jgi:hypothetical protein
VILAMGALLHVATKLAGLMFILQNQITLAGECLGRRLI